MAEAPADNLSFLSGGGDMGARMRAQAWSANPLGPLAAWPQSLRTAVSIMLTSKFPMFLAWGPSLRFLYNDGYSQILGSRHPGALGKAFADIWPEIWADISPIIDRALEGEGSFWENLPLVMERKGFREQTWFTFSYSPLRDESGAIAGMFCACVETTDTVLAEQRRVDEADRLKKLFHDAPGFMAVLRGPDHIFEMLNGSYLQVVGHRDLVGKPVLDALPEVRDQGFVELLDQVYRSGRAFNGRAVPIALQRMPNAAPEERLLDFVYQPITDATGQVTGIFVEGADVTERIQAEQALRESEQRFRLIADLAPVPMWVTKIDRTRGFVNHAYAEFLGATYEEALAFDWRRIVHPDDAERVMRESIAGEASLTAFTMEARYRRRDGDWRWLRSVSQPRWEPGGAFSGFIGVALDVTDAKQAEGVLRELNEELERRVEERTADLSAALDRLQAEVNDRVRAEELLRQAQKMEAVGQLTGGIAHDFNNLLTPILGGLEIIASRVEDARLARMASSALDAARRGAKLTGQLLAFSRIQRISMAPVAIHDVIENMQDMLRHTIGGGVHVETRFDPAVTHGLCDANQLENAILNLAINARDAMPNGGTLTIATEQMQLDPGPDVEGGPFVCISVADTGSGMSPEVLARATEPFFSTKPVGKGTGLGLAQVYGIARQSGGTLRIRSEEGQGTSVQLLLPAAGAVSSAGTPSTLSATAQDAAAATILIIDDDDDVRRFLVETLEGIGHSTVAAASGDEGLGLLKSCTPDLVLLDYAMPGMSGAEVARSILAEWPDMPIIFVTGYAESEQIDLAGGPEVTVLRKPFTLMELAAAIASKLPARRLEVAKSAT